MARILVVDDETDITAMIALMLKNDKHDVDSAADGFEALAALGVEPRDDSRVLPDLVLMDVMMPRMDGYEVCARAADDERAGAVPVILMTARGALKDPHRHTRNVAGHLDKPFRPADLRRVVGEALAGRS